MERLARNSKKSRGIAVSRFDVETLEPRRLMSAGGADHAANEFVYTESNNPSAGQNAVIAFQRNAADGSLTQIGQFQSGGTGFGNSTQGLGPDDSDQEVVASPDGRLLFAVNQGSNSVAVFQIHANGQLRQIGTFDSGGVQPVSLGLTADHLYVVNRGDVLQGQSGTIAPNIAAFDVHHNGRLSAIAGSTITLPVGLSPAQTLISRDGRFVFADNFAIPGTTPPLGQTIDPFRIRDDGTLQQAPSGPVTATVNPDVLLGLAVHPTRPIIYGGLTGANAIGVFTYDGNGSVTFVGSVADQGGKAACWVTVSADGRFLYASNTGTDSIGVFSLADPLHPVQIQEFKLAGPYAPAGVSGSETADFQIALDPTGKSLYAITQDTAATRDFQKGNAVHALAVAPDGTLSESNAPVTFTPAQVPAAARLQGVAVVAEPQNRSDDEDDAGHLSHSDDVVGSVAAFFRSPFGTSEIRDSASTASDVVDQVSGRHEGR